MLKVVEAGLYAGTLVLLLNSLFLGNDRVVRGKSRIASSCLCPSCTTITLLPYQPASTNKSETFDVKSSKLLSNPSFRPISSFVPPGKSTLTRIPMHNSLTRIASQLDANKLSCPSNSLMLTDWQHTVPTHGSCPALFLVGARKGGTTSFYQYLSQHPDFQGANNLDSGPKAGETFHFSSRYYSEKWTAYMAKFPKQVVMTGDASVGNLVNCDVPRRIFETCHNFSKIIVLLRNPVDRFYSNFLMRTQLGTRHFGNNSVLSTTVKIEFEHYFEALIAAGIDPGKPIGQWTRYRCLFPPSRNMVFEGLYYVHLSNWLCNYPAENIMIINSEEFFSDTVKVLSQAFQFLGLSPVSNETLHYITSVVYNKGKKSSLSHQWLTSADRKKIERVYEPFNKKLFELLNWEDIEYW